MSYFWQKGYLWTAYISNTTNETAIGIAIFGTIAIGIADTKPNSKL